MNSNSVPDKHDTNYGYVWNLTCVESCVCFSFLIWCFNLWSAGRIHFSRRIRKCDAPFKNLSKKFRHGYWTEPKVATYEKPRCVLNSSMIHFAMAEFFLTIQHRSYDQCERPHLNRIGWNFISMLQNTIFPGDSAPREPISSLIRSL